MKINPFRAILALVGQILIVCVFAFAIPPQVFISESVRWLDFSVISIVYWIWACICMIPPVDMNDRAHRQIGALGIRWSAALTYSSLALLTVLLGVMLPMQGLAFVFVWQILIQAVLIFFFLVSASAANAASDKVADIKHKENVRLAGKKDMKAAVSSLLDSAQDNPSVSPDIIDIIRDCAAETRYITPASSIEARDAEDTIADICLDIRGALTDPQFNKDRINMSLSRLKRALTRRKDIMN